MICFEVEDATNGVVLKYKRDGALIGFNCLDSRSEAVRDMASYLDVPVWMDSESYFNKPTESKPQTVEISLEDAKKICDMITVMKAMLEKWAFGIVGGLFNSKHFDNEVLKQATSKAESKDSVEKPENINNANDRIFKCLDRESRISDKIAELREDFNVQKKLLWGSLRVAHEKLEIYHKDILDHEHAIKKLEQAGK